MSGSVAIRKLILLSAIFGQITSQNDSTGVPQDDIPYLKKDRCLIRYTFKDAIRNMYSCDIVRKMNPICGRDITIGFSNYEPYSMEYKGKNGTTNYLGILFGKVYV